MYLADTENCIAAQRVPSATKKNDVSSSKVAKWAGAVVQVVQWVAVGGVGWWWASLLFLLITRQQQPVASCACASNLLHLREIFIMISPRFLRRFIFHFSLLYFVCFMNAANGKWKLKRKIA